MRQDRDEYTPIPGAVYCAYELAILHRSRLQVATRGHGLARLEILDPVNLRTRRHAEYLIARTPAGTPRVLRLDHIRSTRTLS